MVVKYIGKGIKKGIDKAREHWKYDDWERRLLKEGKAEVIEGGDKGKRVKKYSKKKPTDKEKASVKVTKSGNVSRLHWEGVNRMHLKKKKLPSLSGVQDEVKKVVKNKNKPRSKVVDIETKEEYISPLGQALRNAYEGKTLTQKELDLINNASKKSLDKYLSGKKPTKPKNGKKK
jgi:hypothetical protein